MRAYTFLRLALILFFLQFSQFAKADGVVSFQTIYSFGNSSSSDPTVVCLAVVPQFQYGAPLYPAWTNYVDLTDGRSNCVLVYQGVPSVAATLVPTNSCPVNSTGVSTCICNSGFVPNAGATACVASSCAAAAGVVLSSGFFDVGTVPTGAPLLNVCKNSCSAQYSGDGVGFRRLVNGVYHYYAKGEYQSSGLACNGDPVLTAETITTLGGDSCAPGQSSITMGGKTKCFNSDGTIASTASASAVAVSQSMKDAKIASAVQAAGDSMSTAGGSASDVQAAKSVAAGMIAAGGTSGDSNSNDPVLDSFCKQNPTASVCVENDFGTVEDSVLTNQTINVAINPVSVGGAGSCPAPTPMVLHGQTYYFNWTTYCNFANGIRPILLAFAWLSAAGLMVGGFKSA